MPHKPMDYDPAEPDVVIWKHLTDNSYDKKVFTRKKGIADRRKQLSQKDYHDHWQNAVDGSQIQAMIQEAQFALGLRKPPNG